MKLSGRFDITNRAMGGVAALRNRKQWWSESRRLRDLLCLSPSLRKGPSLTDKPVTVAF
jgi:hypothetical protein